MNTFKKILVGLTSLISKFPGITLGLIILLLGCTIYQRIQIHLLSEQIPEENPTPVVTINTSKGDVKTQTDIIAKKDSFIPVPSYSQKVLPNKITYWDTKTVLPEEKVLQDTIKDTSTDLSSYYYRDFLNSSIIPGLWTRKNDSISQILLSYKNLTLTAYNKSVGKFSTDTYKLELDRYQYNWQPSTGLTREKKMFLSIQPYIQARYQPLHTVFNLGTGISFKTRNLNYNLGIGLNRDARVNPKVYFDLEFSVTYYLVKWQK